MLKLSGWVAFGVVLVLASGYTVIHTSVEEASIQHMVKIRGGEAVLGGEDHFLLNALRNRTGFSEDFLAAAIAPPKKIVIKRAFYMDQLEVTNQAYTQFLGYLKTSKHDRRFCHFTEPADKDHTPELWGDIKYNDKRQPVVGVDWWDAYAFAQFAGKRLATDDEWEFAARGQEARLYPWGNEFAPGKANIDDPKLFFPVADTLYPDGDTPEGVSNLAGNVREWTLGQYYFGIGKPSLRGGGCYSRPGMIFALSYLRLTTDREVRYKDIGIRCVSNRPVIYDTTAQAASINLQITLARLSNRQERANNLLYTYFRSELGKQAPSQKLINAGEFEAGGFSDSWLLALARKIGASNLPRLLEFPPTHVKLPDFYIDSTEVTNAQYREFLQHWTTRLHWFCHPLEPDRKNHTPKYWQSDSLDHPRQPVVGVDWWDAYACANFSGKRLPSAVEWEFAARGADGRPYPWGQNYIAGAANDFYNGISLPAKVDSFRADVTSDGAIGMGGNVSEWTSTVVDTTDISPMGIVMGGSYQHEGSLNSIAFIRSKADFMIRDAAIGFRCATSTPRGLWRRLLPWARTD